MHLAGAWRPALEERLAVDRAILGQRIPQVDAALLEHVRLRVHHLLHRDLQEAVTLPRGVRRRGRRVPLDQHLHIGRCRGRLVALRSRRHAGDDHGASPALQLFLELAAGARTPHARRARLLRGERARALDRLQDVAQGVLNRPRRPHLPRCIFQRALQRTSHSVERAEALLEVASSHAGVGS